ncbi:MAG: SDR family NAD(P)-dependent oxidoreductase [Proteobacteria bacterium]|nr:SDR family NAD(P)-dependent oxidoreductase [Pseudomonadota bacterium]
MPKQKLQDKVAIVTGGSRGIGAAIARSLAASGASVVACSVSGNKFASSHPNLVFERCDVRSYSSVLQLVEVTVEMFGGLDILINNAGVCHRGDIEDLTIDQWDEVLATNLSGAFYFAKAAVPHIRARGGGHIINMSSRSAVNGFRGGVAYNASKFGLNGLTEALFLDMAPHNIKVTSIMPGRVATDFGGEESQDWQISPEDVARAVVESLSVGPAATISKIEIRPLNNLSKRDE